MAGELASAVGLSDVQRGAYRHLMRMDERRMADGELVARSRLAVSQSFAALARVPELSFVGQLARSGRTETALPAGDAGAPWSARAWLGLEARSDLRFFFDVDDGATLRRDEVGVVLGSEDDVPRETESILFDLAQAAIPEQRPRLFIARVRDQDGKCIYEGSMRLKPLPAVRNGKDRRT